MVREIKSIRLESDSDIDIAKRLQRHYGVSTTTGAVREALRRADMDAAVGDIGHHTAQAAAAQAAAAQAAAAQAAAS